MSRLILHSGKDQGETFPLIATPPEVTHRAIFSEDPKEVYFYWLDKNAFMEISARNDGFNCCGGNDQGTHHTMDCAKFPGAEDDTVLRWIEDHKWAVEEFLDEHPDHEWDSNEEFYYEEEGYDEP